VPQWKEDIYPEIKRGAKKAGATIYFTDESGISSDYHTGRPGQQREIGRKAVNSLAEKRSHALGGRQRWQKTPRRIQSFFDQPACQYARIQHYFSES